MHNQAITQPIRPQYVLAPSGFHGDMFFQDICNFLLKNVRVFIEHGSNVGSTLQYVVKLHPHIHAFSCEPNPEAFVYLTRNVQDYKNAHVYPMDAMTFIKSLVKANPNITKENIVFWLDAHGGNFKWPLREEIQLITENFEKALILIDDFLVPEHPEFGYDEYDGQVCSMDYIRDCFSKNNKYGIYYPNYTERTSTHHPLRGWVLIEYNQDSRITDILKTTGTIKLAEYI